MQFSSTCPKFFDTVWIDGLLYKLTLLNFPSHTVHTFSFYLGGRSFETSFQTATSSPSRHADWGSSGWIDLPCPLQSVCQQHALTLTPHRVGPLRRSHGHHSHVPQADTARQLPGFIPQRTSMMVE